MDIKKTFNLPPKYIDYIISIKDGDDTLLSETAALIKIIKEHMEYKK